LLIGAEIQNLLDFHILVNQETGEVPTDKKKSANLKNMIFTLTPNDRFAKVGGSVHQYANGGKLNNDRFTIERFRQVANELRELINPNDDVNVLEWGINLIVPFDPTDFIKNLISHQKTQFNKTKQTNEVFAEIRYTHYRIKVYNKGIQQPTGSYILRIELHYVRMQNLFPEGLKWSRLGALETWDYLGKVLIEKFNDVIYYDPSINLDQVPEKEKRIIEKGHNPIYWQNNKSAHADRDRKKFQDLIKKHGTKFNSISNLIDQEVTVLVKNYHYSEEANIEDELSGMVKSYHYSTPEDPTIKDINFDPLVKCYPLLSCTNSPTNINTTDRRFCKITGIDISMQKSGSVFLCVSGIQSLMETDQITFNKLRFERLSPKWRNEPFEVQVREIAHSIRNEYNNPRHNAKRDIQNLLSYPVLFDLVPFIRPDRMRVSGLSSNVQFV